MNVRDWVRCVFGWDGLLPAGIALLTVGIDWVLPNAPGAVTFAAVAVPIAALFVRFAVGRRRIAAHRVGPGVRACQKVVFAAAILWLCLLDSLVIAVQDAPATAADLVSLAVAYGAYLAAMSLAMFPGWEERPADPTEGGAEGTLDD